MNAHQEQFPLEAQFARAITVFQTVPVIFMVLIDIFALVISPLRLPGWSDLGLILGGLGLIGLAVGSAVQLRPGRRWAWWGSMVCTTAVALGLIAVIIYIAQETAGAAGVDPGMVLVSALVVIVPFIALSLVNLVLLMLPAVRRAVSVAESH